MANHVEHITSCMGLLVGDCGLIKGRFIQQKLQQQVDQIHKPQARVVELANADADHAGFAEIVKAEATEDVMNVMGRIDPIVDVIGVGFQVGEIGRVREKVMS